MISNTAEEKKWVSLAFLLGIITIGYNLVEGTVSMYFGVSDDALTLLGFGIDSFVEVLSGIGITHMIYRMRTSKVEEFDRFERQALRVTAVSFYLLAAGLVAGIIINLYKNSAPETTIPGIIISLASVLSMYFLMKYKLKAGRALQSDAIISDAHCTRTCLYLSVILLVSSALYEFTGIRYLDVLGSAGIAWFAFTEGREAFEKAAKGKAACSCGHD
jgi:hypothetical protein